MQEPILRRRDQGQGLFFNETNKGFLGKDVGFYERTQPFSLDLWFFAGQVYKFHPNEMLGATGKGLPYGVPLLQHRDTTTPAGRATGCSSKTVTCGCIWRTRGRRT